MDKIEISIACFFGGLVIVIIGVLAWALLADSREMDRKKSAFYDACLMERKSYDCDMQWQTYETAHNAELAAGMAVGIAAGKK